MIQRSFAFMLGVISLCLFFVGASPADSSVSTQQKILKASEIFQLDHPGNHGAVWTSPVGKAPGKPLSLIVFSDSEGAEEDDEDGDGDGEGDFQYGKVLLFSRQLLQPVFEVSRQQLFFEHALTPVVLALRERPPKAA